MTMTFKDSLIAHLQGEKVECRGAEARWLPLFPQFDNVSCGRIPEVGGIWEFRLKPRTILVNGVEVPAPEKEAPADGADYFIPVTTFEDLHDALQWDGSLIDSRWLKAGLVYLDKESAIARAKAMLITQEVK